MTRTTDYDVTGKIGPLYPQEAEPAWPMYSFDVPSRSVWCAIAQEMRSAGWRESRIRDWLQSKEARWALDGELGSALVEAARDYAAKHITRKVVPLVA